MNQEKLVLTALLSGTMLLSGCGMFKSEVDKCHEEREYQSARSSDRAVIPEGLQPLPDEARLPIPYGETKTEPTPPEEPCLIEPPEYRVPD